MFCCFLGVNTELLDTLLCPETEDASGTNPNSRSSDASSQDEASNGDGGQQNGSPGRSAKRRMQSFNTLLINKLMAIANLSCKPGKLYRFGVTDVNQHFVSIESNYVPLVS